MDDHPCIFGALVFGHILHRVLLRTWCRFSTALKIEGLSKNEEVKDDARKVTRETGYKYQAGVDEECRGSGRQRGRDEQRARLRPFRMASFQASGGGPGAEAGVPRRAVERSRTGPALYTSTAAKPPRVRDPSRPRSRGGDVHENPVPGDNKLAPIVRVSTTLAAVSIRQTTQSCRPLSFPKANSSPSALSPANLSSPSSPRWRACS